MTTDLTIAGPWSEPTIIEIDALPLVVVRHEGVRIGDLRGIFDSCFGPVQKVAGEAGLSLTGPAYAVYEGDPMDVFNLEVGHPVDRPLPEALEIDGVRVIPSELAAGRYALLTHIGPYDGLGNAWGHLMGWVGEQHLAPGARYGEIYVTEPTPDADASQLRSDLFLSLR
ncbi:GyrI-like domain-containing protein [Tessaracoccus caeni]|uniref:GyrI-like domain-containing protein n=1 Tax=Tessaracoccus caeni TaxID=3031239 RepID=UPI0023D97BAD|nr:GyrI-like domain-containing protein [Tessaracoccus caeni]MDF1489109.1 GyrI-like domain-containing protein [Tessaracoccus caeni]